MLRETFSTRCKGISDGIDLGQGHALCSLLLLFRLFCFGLSFERCVIWTFTDSPNLYYTAEYICSCVLEKKVRAVYMDFIHNLVLLWDEVTQFTHQQFIHAVTQFSLCIIHLLRQRPSNPAKDMFLFCSSHLQRLHCWHLLKKKKKNLLTQSSNCPCLHRSFWQHNQQVFCLVYMPEGVILSLGIPKWHNIELLSKCVNLLITCKNMCYNLTACYEVALVWSPAWYITLFFSRATFDLIETKNDQ